MGIIELIDQSAATALEHAAELQDRLRDLGSEAGTECHAEMHVLVGDIVSLRNAAKLLIREVRAAS
ncbi:MULTISPECIES: hypothetical protein [unclassified Nocardioides]|uniref:hypothetical protein n=1 Tax=unclassified Nocardioides TaxID=2615069 RepID=UPI003619B705